MLCRCRVSAALDFPRDRAGNNLVLHCTDLEGYNKEVRELLSTLPEHSNLVSYYSWVVRL